MSQDNRSILSTPPRGNIPSGRSSSPAQNHAAANILRQQIDAIYQNDPSVTQPAASRSEPANNAVQPPQTTEPSQPAAPSYTQPSGTIAQKSEPSSQITPGPGAIDTKKEDSPYDRTMSQDSPLKTQDSSWQKYHTAWQSYYQQYYERYYVSQIQAAKKSLNDQAEIHRTAAEKNPSRQSNEPLTEDEAVADLRGDLRKKINQRAKKIRKSRHFMPVMAAVGVLLVFLFLQYNRVLFAYVEAYVAPGAMDAESIIVSPTSEAAVSADPKLIIPKIAVDVPIVFTADASSQDSLNSAMNHGVVWFNMQGANARPGEQGNFVLSGHSANDWADGGAYKFIFARLERIKEGDVVYVNYNSKRYTYKITRTQIVKPTDVSALQTGNDKPYITLITCVPLGTALNRLLVFGEQISPNPNEAAKPSTSTNTSSTTNSKMPANSPTFLERLFGAR